MGVYITPKRTAPNLGYSVVKRAKSAMALMTLSGAPRRAPLCHTVRARLPLLIRVSHARPVNRLKRSSSESSIPSLLFEHVKPDRDDDDDDDGISIIDQPFSDIDSK